MSNIKRILIILLVFLLFMRLLSLIKETEYLFQKTYGVSLQNIYVINKFLDNYLYENSLFMFAILLSAFIYSIINYKLNLKIKIIVKFKSFSILLQRLNRKVDKISLMLKIIIITLKKYGYVVLAIIINSILIIFPRLFYKLPIGGDTLAYMYIINTMETEGIYWAIKYTDRPFFYILIFLLKHILALSTDVTFEIIPVFLGLTLIISVWWFLACFDIDIANYSILILAGSTSLMRKSIDLYDSLFGESLMFGIFALYKSYLDNGRENKFKAALSSVIIVILLLSYWFLWALSFIIMISYIVFTHDKKKNIKKLLLLFLPSFILFIMFTIYALIFPAPIYWGLGASFLIYLGIVPASHYYLGLINEPTSIVRTPILSPQILSIFIANGDIILFILGVVGLIIPKPHTYELKIIHIMSVIIVGLFLIGIFPDRVALLFPLFIYAAFSLKKIRYFLCK